MSSLHCQLRRVPGCVLCDLSEPSLCQAPSSYRAGSLTVLGFPVSLSPGTVIMGGVPGLASTALCAHTVDLGSQVGCRKLRRAALDGASSGRASGREQQVHPDDLGRLRDRLQFLFLISDVYFVFMKLFWFLF
ncbi:hypothetical protein mRhiFer1_009206 [Rhinolophus ferrumequinum]|uniref:Uncharacterized protein n=1 Tax=Rhinolophus ferrumequinum TaxID=59479 RepID=A0A7J7SJ80_RHIFE|nr:hypothetical protein mRhiFer1_009206 [Rhinolophus ferrumequinum]